MEATRRAPSLVKAINQLSKLVAKYFNLAELPRLARNAGIDPDELLGQTLSDRAYNLVDAAVRQDLLDDLCTQLQEERPKEKAQWSARHKDIRSAEEEDGGRKETPRAIALERGQRRGLIKALHDCPSLSSQEGRDRVRAELHHIVKKINQSSDQIIDIADIVDGAANHSGGLEELVETLRLYEDDPKALQNLETVWDAIRGASPAAPAHQLSRHYTVDRDQLFHEFDLIQQAHKFTDALQKQPPSNIVIYVTPAREAYLFESYVLPRFEMLATVQRQRHAISFRKINLRQSDLQNQPLSAALVIWKLNDIYPELQLADLFDEQQECLLTIFNDDIPAGLLQEVAESFVNELQSLAKAMGKPAGRYLVIVWVNLLGEPLQISARDEPLRLINAGEIPALGNLSRQDVVNWLEVILPRMGVEKPDVDLTAGYLKQNLRDDPAPLHRIYIALEGVRKFLQEGA